MLEIVFFRLKNLFFTITRLDYITRWRAEMLLISMGLETCIAIDEQTSKFKNVSLCDFYR